MTQDQSKERNTHRKYLWTVVNNNPAQPTVSSELH